LASERHHGTACWGRNVPTPFKSAMKLVGSFVPVIYCGYLVYYFVNLGGSLQEIENDGLGPTVLGLTIVGLLFSIPLIVKVALVVVELRKRKSGTGGGEGPPRGGDEPFDADALVARYMAQRADAVSGSAAAPDLQNEAPGVRPSFGRRIR
jgi:hypothetical protein